MEIFDIQGRLEMGFLNADAHLLYFIWLDAIQLTLRHSCGFLSNFAIPSVLMFQQGKSKNAKEVLKRIDYGGIFTLFIAVSLMYCTVTSFS
jgi:hypothetical protein